MHTPKHMITHTKGPALTLFMGLSVALLAPAGARANPPGIELDLGPLKGAAGGARRVQVESGVLRQAKLHDVQDGMEHNVRGLPLRDLLAQAKLPKKADAVVLVYDDGMEIPVKLGDRDVMDALFVAFEHGDVLNHFETSYPIRRGPTRTCPKVVYTRPVDRYSIWIYPGNLIRVRAVTWKAWEAMLAQPTRKLPDRSGWPLYLTHCASCHGIGGQGAKRGPDFLSHMDAYRRVPPLAQTSTEQHPSLHEKVKGYTDGTMPVLNHISNAEITRLWRWLHAIHDTATK